MFRDRTRTLLISAKQCKKEKYPQIVAWEVHVGEQEVITHSAGGAALGQDTEGGASLSLEVFKPCHNHNQPDSTGK